MQDNKIFKYVSIVALIFAFHTAVSESVAQILNTIGGCGINFYSNTPSCYIMGVQVGPTIVGLIGYGWNTVFFLPAGLIVSLITFIIYKRNQKQDYYCE